MVCPVDPEAPAKLPMRGGCLEVRFESLEDLQKQKDEYICNHSLFVSSQSEAPAFCEFTLTMILPNGVACDPVPARLVQLAPGMGLFLQFISVPGSLESAIDHCLENPSETKEKEAFAFDQIPDLPPELPDELPVDLPDELPPELPDEVHQDEEPEPSPGRPVDRMSLHEKLRRMNPNERSRLAGRANKITRSLLIRDIEPQVIMFLLKNPRITRAEVVEISKSPRIGYQAVKIILGNKTWSQSEEIRYNLVQNPKTPLPDALKLIPGLNMKHLRELAKNHNLKQRIKQSALRLVLERGSM